MLPLCSLRRQSLGDRYYMIEIEFNVAMSGVERSSKKLRPFDLVLVLIQDYCLLSTHR